jgi:hypothetical protein
VTDEEGGGVSEPAAADHAFAAYLEVIEAHFRTRRGAPTTLSPRDFALARGWYQAGVPQATVLLGIDRAFEGEPGVSSLAFCRRRIEDLASAGPRSATAAPGGAARASSSDVEEVLGMLKERLLSLPPKPRSAFELPLRRIEEVQDLVAVASRPNWEYVQAKLREIDDAVSAGALLALPAEEADALRAEARRAGERHRGRVDPASLEDAVSRFAVQRARETLGLPKVSLG